MLYTWPEMVEAGEECDGEAKFRGHCLYHNRMSELKATET